MNPAGVSSLSNESLEFIFFSKLPKTLGPRVWNMWLVCGGKVMNFTWWSASICNVSGRTWIEQSSINNTTSLSANSWFDRSSSMYGRRTIEILQEKAANSCVACVVVSVWNRHPFERVSHPWASRSSHGLGQVPQHWLRAEAGWSEMAETKSQRSHCVDFQTLFSRQSDAPARRLNPK
jgi:hypothetical protein